MTITDAVFSVLCARRKMVKSASHHSHIDDPYSTEHLIGPAIQVFFLLLAKTFAQDPYSIDFFWGC